MLMTQRHHEATEAIDAQFSANYAFSQHRLLEDGQRYTSWYAKALTTLALMTGDEEVRFAYTNYAHQTPSYMVVYTEHCVFFLTVPDLSVTDPPAVRAFARSALVGCEVAASQRIDSEGRQAQTWPGETHVRLQYLGLEQEIEMTTLGYNQYRLNDPDPLIVFLPSLLVDVSSPAKTRIS